MSALLWAGVGAWPLLRFRVFSPFERSLVAFSILIALWAGLDWYFLGLTDATQADLAVLVSNIRITVITAATSALLLASKWIYLGHARWDPLLLLPAVGSFVIIWTGLTSGVEPASWGPRLIRDRVLYSIWAAQQVVYVGASIAFTFGVWRARRKLAARLRRRVAWTGGSLLILLAIWLSTNIYNNVTQTAGVPWFSSALIIPAGIIMVVLVPLSQEEIGEVLRGLSAVEERARAVYLFSRSGEPLVALSSERTYPIEAEQLEGVLSLVGNFVETSVASGRRFDITAMRYETLGILAVRGQYVIAAAIYEGRAYDALRSELVRIVRNLEEQHGRELQSWEQATQVSETVADELSDLIYHTRRQVAGERKAFQESLQAPTEPDESPREDATAPR